MSVPIVLVRVGADVVPVVLGQDGGELRGYDLVHERIIQVAAGDVVGAADTNPAAVFWGMDLVESEVGGRMAAEPDHSCFPPGLRDAYASEAHEDRVSDSSVSLEEFAATFLANVESDGDPYEFQRDPRVETLARTLYGLGLRGVGPILGAGTYGTAAVLDKGRVVKLTSDPSEVQAGAVLRGQRLRNVAHVYESFFVRDVRAKTTIAESPSGRKQRREHAVGVLYVERVMPLDDSGAMNWLRRILPFVDPPAADQLDETVKIIKTEFGAWPDQLEAVAPEVQRERLLRTSRGLESVLRYQAAKLGEQGRDEDAALADGVANGVQELRDRGVYAIDMHSGNVGFVESRAGAVTYKVFDIGSSSPPARPKAKVVDDSKVSDVEMSGMLDQETAGAAEWVGEAREDAAEPRKVKPVAHLPPQGAKFAPVNLPLFGAVPTVTGYTEVRSQLEKHRNELPSVATIQLSTVFSGLTIMVGIEEAEQAFACISRMYERLGRSRMPTLAEIQDCIVPLGLHQQRTAMYESAGRWAPVVREAMERGLRDRELRRFLYLETELPEGIGLAKISFILALCGQDLCCLDARLMGRMFGPDSRKHIATFAGKRDRRALAAYEATEDAFLSGNPFYVPSDPIGRARAQWMSWEIVGHKPATHSTWLQIVR